MANSTKGFASMSPERRKEIARLGGASKAPHLRAFADKELAKRAGALGGKAKAENAKAKSRDA